MTNLNLNHLNRIQILPVTSGVFQEVTPYFFPGSVVIVMLEGQVIKGGVTSTQRVSSSLLLHELCLPPQIFSLGPFTSNPSSQIIVQFFLNSCLPMLQDLGSHLPNLTCGSLGHLISTNIQENVYC